MRSRLFMVVVALAGIALLVDALIVTDEERLIVWSEQMSAAVSASDAEAMRPLFDPAFAYEGREVDEALAYAVSMRKRSGSQSVTIQLERIEIDGDLATAEGLILGAAMGRPVRLRSQLAFRKGEEGWVLTRASAVRFR